jgi:hypothetical protein
MEKSGGLDLSQENFFHYRFVKFDSHIINKLLRQYEFTLLIILNIIYETQLPI